MGRRRDPWQVLGELESTVAFPVLGASTLLMFLLVGSGVSLFVAVALLLGAWYAGLVAWMRAASRGAAGAVGEEPDEVRVVKRGKKSRRVAASPYRESARDVDSEEAMLEERALERFERWTARMPMVPADPRAMVKRVSRRAQMLARLTTTIMDARTGASRQIVQTKPWRNFELEPLLDRSKRICEVSRDRPLSADDLPEEVLEQWRPEQWPAIHVRREERISSQTLLQIEVSAVDVMYAVGPDPQQTSFLGPQQRPVEPCDDQLFKRRARWLQVTGSLLVMVPVGLLLWYGLRGGFYRSEAVALLVVTSTIFSALCFAAMWRWTLRWPVRWWLAAVLSVGLFGGALIARIAPSADDVRALLAEHKVEEAEHLLMEMGYVHNPRRESYWVDRLALSVLTADHCGQAQQRLEQALDRAAKDGVTENLMMALAIEHLERKGCGR